MFHKIWTKFCARSFIQVALVNEFCEQLVIWKWWKLVMNPAISQIIVGVPFGQKSLYLIYQIPVSD